MNVINWILLFLVFVFTDAHPIPIISLGVILFYLTPYSIYDFVRFYKSGNESLAAMRAFMILIMAFLGGMNIGYLYEGRYYNPAIPGAWFMVLYLGFAYGLCAYMSIKK